MSGDPRKRWAPVRAWRRSTAGLLLGLVALAGSSVSAAPAQRPDEDVAREYFTDTVLVDQAGRRHRFYSDLLAGRCVVIGSFFGDCTGACPVTLKKFAALRDHLADRVGSEVVLISITVDPVTDTPERLAEYASRIEAGEGWHLLTGPPADVEAVLRPLGLHTEQREAHTNILLIGNTRTGLWKKAFALGPTEELMAIVDSVVEDSP